MSDAFELSRRKTLAALGTIGAASAGAGLGTSAYFSDRETLANNSLVAGSLDVKAAYSVHYSDWSDDETDGLEGAVTMTDDRTFDPGPTTLPGVEFATESDLQQFLANTEVAEVGDASCPDGTDAEDLEQPMIRVEDVKPGDFGEVTLDFALCDNPGYVWLEVGTAHAGENGYTEPEADDPDESGTVFVPGVGEVDEHVELLDEVRAAYWIDDGDNYVDDDESFASVGSLREIIDELAGLDVALPGDITAEDGGGTGTQGCFSPETAHSIGVVWWVPVDHGNEIQTDSVEFDLRLYTEQCRHNDGQRNRLQRFLNADAALKASPVWDDPVVDETGGGPVEVVVGARTDVDVPDFPPKLPVAFAPQVVRVSTGTEVTWRWREYDDGIPPIPHNVVSLTGEFNSDDVFGRPVPPKGPDTPPWSPTTPTFSHTFTDAGTYLYFCHPHGAPHLVGSALGGEVLNEFGMRGAVIVED